MTQQTIEERTAAREAALIEAVANQRRLANPADYVFDKAQEAFWDMSDLTLHSEKSVDASIPLELWRVEVEEPEPVAEGAAPRRGRPPRRRERLIPPSRDIMRVENDQFVEGSTWWPGEAKIIHDRFIDANGAYESPGRRIFNQYKPPPAPKGNPKKAQQWVDHVKKVWPEEMEHNFFFDACAHMLQKPHEKLNAGIVLSGKQGIGKDAALWPVKMAIGQWNAKGIDPDELFSQFRPWLQTLMLVVDEVRPSKDEFHASSMYNILKPMLVAPPDTLPLNDKHVKLRYITNVLRVFITTNDWMAMYIPPEDRRMFIMHSHLEQKWHETAGDPDYFVRLFGWMEADGKDHIAAWLAARDISSFNAKAQVRKTSGWDAVAATWGEPEDSITWAVDRLGTPDVILSQDLLDLQFDGREEVASMLKSPRKIGHRMQRAGYVAVAPANGDQRWTFRPKEGTEGGRVIRARYAFVSSKLAPDQNKARAAILLHGSNRASGTKSVED